MAITDNRKLGTAFEATTSTANTTENKAFYEEGVSLPPDIRSSEMYAEAVPYTPPTLAFGEDNGIVKRVRMALTLDNSVNDKRAWLTVNPWASGWSSGSYDPETLMNRWLSNKDGPGYLPKIFGGSNGDSEIPPLDATAPMFTPRSGLLTFGSARSEAGTSESTSIWIEGYVYVGKMQNEIGGLDDIDADFLADYNGAKTAP